jgi:uncharacterized protein
MQSPIYTATQIAAQLQLLPHPEGGFYKETYRSTGSIPQSALAGFNGSRSYGTGIYFMLTGGNFSAFHRIKSDELWHFYDGSVCQVHVIHLDGTYQQINLGRDIAAGQVYQALVPAGAWFASHCIASADDAYSLVGCTVSPGFDFADFEMATRNALISAYPQHSQIITALTRLG